MGPGSRGDGKGMSKMELIVRIVVAVGVVVLALLSIPAEAQHAQGGGRQAGPGRPTAPQQAPARDMRWQQRDANRDARMTPEQRRQLRRDVADHGRDIYGRPNPNKR